MPGGNWCFELSRKCLLDERTGPLVAIASLAVAIITLLVGVGVAIWVYRRQERVSKQLASIQTELAWNSRRDEVIERLRTDPDEAVAQRRLREAEKYVHSLNPRAATFSYDLVDLHRAYWANRAVQLPNADTWPTYPDAVCDIAMTLPQRFSSEDSCFDLLSKVKPFLKRLAEDGNNLPWEAIEVFRNRRGFDEYFIQALLRDAPQLAPVVSSLADTRDLVQFGVVVTGLADAVRYEFSRGLDEKAANSVGSALCDISQSPRFGDWLRTREHSLTVLVLHLRCISKCFQATDHYVMCKAVHECLRHVPLVVSAHSRATGDEDQVRSDLRFARTHFAKWHSTVDGCSYCQKVPTRDVALAAISQLEGLLAATSGGA